VRRRILNYFLGYEIHREAHIGLSWVLPRSKLVMGPGSRIRHFTVIHSVAEVCLDTNAYIGSLNWITDNLAGYGGPVSTDHERRRRPALTLGRFAATTTRHYFDCSDLIEIGENVIVGGIRTVMQTHYLNLETLEQTCRPIRVGADSFISTNCLLLGGAALPDRTVLAAGSVLIDEKTESHCLYAGNPATRKKVFDSELPFFKRTEDSVMDARRPVR
jgi:acetyltransferase-like isoleucine patch superfamily enzyme